MSAVVCYDEQYVPAHPLGIPVDGRPRYGMEPEQAKLYRWLLANRAHHEEFRFDFRAVALAIGSHHGTVHNLTKGLVERGWLYRADNSNHLKVIYGFVQPVVHFREPSNG